MNLEDIARNNVRSLVQDPENTLNLGNIDELKEWVRAGWDVLDITKPGSFFQLTLEHFYHIPYGRNDHASGEISNRTLRPEVPAECSKIQRDHKRIKLLQGADFAEEFENFFKKSMPVKVIILHTDRISIYCAIEGLVRELGLRKDVEVATYVPVGTDLPITTWESPRRSRRR